MTARLALREAVQGARHVVEAYRWPGNLNLTGAVLTGTKREKYKAGVTAVDGTLTPDPDQSANPGAFTWDYGPGDVGTAGVFFVQLKATFADFDATIESRWVVHGLQSASAVAAEAVVGVPQADADFLAALEASAAAATVGQVATADGLGGAAFEDAAGGGTWGSITGTLSDQTDLQGELDALEAEIGAAVGGRMDWVIHVPGTLSQNVNARWTIPVDCRILHISAVTSNNSDATIAFGISSDTDSILVPSTIGDSNVPRVFNSGDWAGTNPTADFTAGQIAVLTVDFDGASGTAGSDLTVIVTTTGNAVGDLADISDLAAAGFSADDYTKFNGSVFVNVTPAGVLADIGAAADVHTHTESDITDLGLYADLRPANTDIAGTTHTFALANEGTIVRSQSGSATVFTVPLNSAVAFPTGTIIGLAQKGAGELSIAATGGVTIHSLNGNLTLAGQHAEAALRKTDTNTWDLVGALKA